MIADLDHFKRINDNHGHAVGDAIIAAFGAHVRLIGPAEMIAGRIGGEEFALLVPGAGIEAARQLAETVRCLPALLRIPRLEPDGGFSLTTRAPLDLGQRGLVLFFAAWPVAEGGTVDLLQADGYLKPQQVDDHSLRFPGGPRQPGKKYPLGGGYLLVL